MSGRHYLYGFGGPSSSAVPHLKVPIGQPVIIAVSLRAPSGVYVGDVWLTVNGYPSGFGFGHPMGKYRLLTHQPGPLVADQQVGTSWTAATLFNTNALDLTIEFTVGDAGTGAPLAHFEVTH